MMKYIIYSLPIKRLSFSLFAFFLIIICPLKANQKKMSVTRYMKAYQKFLKGSFQIDLLTMDSGNKIYNAYGHTALRVKNIISGQYIVFDYGVFRFDYLFIVRFLKGDPVYMLKATTWLKTRAVAKKENRRLYSQELILSEDQARELVRHLFVNSLPKNRNYIYNHYTNNCTTIYRDIINKYLENDFKLVFNKKALASSYRKTTLKMIENDIIYGSV